MNQLLPFINETATPIYALVLSVKQSAYNRTLDGPNHTQCFPEGGITAELYNVDHTNLEVKLLWYVASYSVLTFAQIYLMTSEYLKMLIIRRHERRGKVALYPYFIMSMWNCISLVLHLVFGLRLFSNYRKLIWLLVSCIAVSHFSVQRKFMIEVWKANNPTSLFQRNPSKSFYGRYYFMLMLLLMVTY